MAEIARTFSGNNEFVISDTGERFQLLPEDTIYLIQDIDEYEDVILKEIEKGLPENSKWIISNPCFEIWLYYHYFKSPMPHLKDIPDDRAQRGRWMKRKNNQLVKGGIPTMEVLYLINNAISNSKSNYSESNHIPSLFSTQMHCLSEEIIRIIETDRFETAKKSHIADRIATALKYGKGLK